MPARWTAAFLALALATASCGYRMVGQGAAGSADSRALWVAPVEDDAAEPLFGVRLGQHLARDTVTTAGFTLAPEAGARRLLRVRVEQVSEKGAAFVAGDLTQEYVVEGVVSAYLTLPDGEILWKGSGIRADREFATGADVNQTESNKDQALDLLARDLSREVLRRAGIVNAGLAP